MNNGLPEAIAGKRVLVIGDVMLDHYVWGRVRRVSPEAPVPVVEVERNTYNAGGAANTAANVVGLGGKAILAGVVGSDTSAEHLRDALVRISVPGEGLICDEQRSTTTKCRIIAHNHQVARLDTESREPIPAAVEEALIDYVRDSIRTVDACVLSDYNKGVVSTRVAAEVIQVARDAGVPIVVDPKGAYFEKYRGASVVTPNIHEAETALNRPIEDEEDLLKAGEQLVSDLCDSAVLITQGASGMSLFRAGAARLRIPAETRNVFDVTGAGDTVVGTLALALAAGASLEDAARLSNLAAGVVVGKFSTATVSLDELSEQVQRL